MGLRTAKERRWYGGEKVDRLIKRHGSDTRAVEFVVKVTQTLVPTILCLTTTIIDRLSCCHHWTMCDAKVTFVLMVLTQVLFGS